MKRDQEQEEQFPGYPHYPSGEDITNKGNKTEQVNMDPDDMGPNARRQSEEQRNATMPKPLTTDEQDAEADVTDEERQLLSAAGQGRDGDDADLEEAKLDETDEDGDPLNEVSGTYGQTGADLDVPGSEADDADEDRGEEDEENNYYSLGGDNHENLEEDNGI